MITTPIERVREWKARGVRIIVDCDDYWVLPSNHYLKDGPYEQTYVPKMLEFVEMADVVWTTNEQLRSKLLTHNPNVEVYPNTMHFEDHEKLPSDKMRFSYIGGITHLPDLTLLRTPFERIGGMPDIHTRATFTLSGFDTKTKSPTWDRMASVFYPTRSFEVYGDLPLTEYMHHYDRADVSLIPLVSNTFNSCKSFLKVVEAGSRGIPCIVSNTLPYTELKDAPGLLWVNNSQDWIKHIRFCLNNPDWVLGTGKLLHDYMKERYSVQDWSLLRYQSIHALLHSNLHKQS